MKARVLLVVAAIMAASAIAQAQEVQNPCAGPALAAPGRMGGADRDAHDCSWQAGANADHRAPEDRLCTRALSGGAMMLSVWPPSY